MAKIKAGTYTIGEIFRIADFDFDAEASSEDRGPDFRRVRVGGLNFDSLEDTVVIPETSDRIVIAVDNTEKISLAVSLNDEQKKIRDFSLKIAAEREDKE